jgi:hypothetical protein
VRRSPRSGRDQAHLVTEARPGLSADIRYRERRYLIMMGIRTVCFITALLMFVNHLGWLTAIPLVGAVVIPYFAVIFANGGREPVSRGFRQYSPNLPERYVPPDSRPPNGGQSGQGSDSHVPPASAAGH